VTQEGRGRDFWKNCHCSKAYSAGDDHDGVKLGIILQKPGGTTLRKNKNIKDKKRGKVVTSPTLSFSTAIIKQEVPASEDRIMARRTGLGA